MQGIQKTAHWAFAAFMAALAYFVCLVLGAFVMLKLVGLPVGVQPPAHFEPQIGVTGMGVLAGILLFVPLAVATVVGAMTAPFAQRGVAAVVFAVLFFAGITLMTYAGPRRHALDIAGLLETAASCAVPAGLIIIWWRRQKLRIAGRSQEMVAGGR